MFERKLKLKSGIVIGLRIVFKGMVLGYDSDGKVWDKAEPVVEIWRGEIGKTGLVARYPFLALVFCKDSLTHKFTDANRGTKLADGTRVEGIALNYIRTWASKTVEAVAEDSAA